MSSGVDFRLGDGERGRKQARFFVRHKCCSLAPVVAMPP